MWLCNKASKVPYEDLCISKKTQKPKTRPKHHHYTYALLTTGGTYLIFYMLKHTHTIESLNILTWKEPTTSSWPCTGQPQQSHQVTGRNKFCRLCLVCHFQAIINTYTCEHSLSVKLEATKVIFLRGKLCESRQPLPQQVVTRSGWVSTLACHTEITQCWQASQSKSEFHFFLPWPSIFS